MSFFMFNKHSQTLWQTVDHTLGTGSKHEIYTPVRGDSLCFMQLAPKSLTFKSLHFESK